VESRYYLTDDRGTEENLGSLGESPKDSAENCVARLNLPDGIGREAE